MQQPSQVFLQLEVAVAAGIFWKGKEGLGSSWKVKDSKAKSSWECMGMNGKWEAEVKAKKGRLSLSVEVKRVDSTPLHSYFLYKWKGMQKMKVCELN